MLLFSEVFAGRFSLKAALPQFQKLARFSNPQEIPVTPKQPLTHIHWLWQTLLHDPQVVFPRAAKLVALKLRKNKIRVDLKELAVLEVGLALEVSNPHPLLKPVQAFWKSNRVETGTRGMGSLALMLAASLFLANCCYEARRLFCTKAAPP